MSFIKILDLPKISDPRGNLTFVEGVKHIPFEFKRVYWIYDVPGGETRGGHAFLEQKEFIIALSGSFDVVLNDGVNEKRFHLNRSYNGLYVPQGIWRSMDNFSTNSVALVLASTLYDEKDYIRDFEVFRKTDFRLINNEKSKNNNSYENKFDVKLTSIWDCGIFNLAINHRDKGNITVAESGINIPFNINRVYYLYDVPGGEERGGHAHKELQQWVIAVSGSFDVVLDDGNEKRTISLNRPYNALRIVPGIWRELVNFSSGSCCLVLASHLYSESDYVRDIEEYKLLKSL